MLRRMDTSRGKGLERSPGRWIIEVPWYQGNEVVVAAWRKARSLSRGIEDVRDTPVLALSCTVG